MKRSNSRRWVCLAALVAAAAAAPAPAPSDDEPARPLLVGNAVALVRGELLVGTVALPPGVYPSAVAPLAGGWIVGGTRATAEGRDLFLSRRRGGRSSEIAGPAAGEPLPRGFAVPLVADGDLAGLLWLEGERSNRLAVRAAARAGAGWGASEVVSEPGPGSQVALAGTVLADGSWLAVWTRVDEAGDAETVWSRRRGGSWSEPERIHEDNPVHDVQPVLAAVDGGALVAWTSFDGRDYRMRHARFDGAGWAVSGPFGGRGAANPRLSAAGEPGGGGGPVHLLFSTADPSTWSVVEFDAAGAAVAAGHLARDPRDAGPVFLGRAGDGAPVLVWPELGDDLPRRRAVLELAPDAAAAGGPAGKP